MATTATDIKPRRPNKVPQNSPFICRFLLCPECGQVVVPTPERMGNNKIVRVTYYHVNENVGCAWKVIDATRYAEGQLVGLRENVPDGVDSNGRPKFMDEHNMAVGTSFDLMKFAHPLYVAETTKSEQLAAELFPGDQIPKPPPSAKKGSHAHGDS